MPAFQLRPINQWYYSGHENANAANDSADEIIAAPDRYLLPQAQFFAAQGGWSTVALTWATVGLGTLAVFAGSPRTAAHFRTGAMGFNEWACLWASGATWYCAAQLTGVHVFGDAQAVKNHWMAYTFVKANNRFEGRRILTKKPTY